MARVHRGATALYALALRFADDLPADRHALLLEAYAQECEIMGQQVEGIAARRRAADLWLTLGNPFKQGENLALSVPMLSRTGQGTEAQRVSRAALDVLHTLPPGRELALAYRVQAKQYLVNRDCQEALVQAQKALDLAERCKDTEVWVTTHIDVGTAWLFLDCERGCEYLERSLAIARDAGLDPQAAYAYTNLGSGCGELYQFQRAERYLEEGITYATERDLDRSRLYMLAWQALTHVHLGCWRAAAEVATTVLQNPSATVTAHITALVALGRLRARQHLRARVSAGDTDGRAAALQASCEDLREPTATF
jgi:tetratricopeptide (TPR) repeat protein